jgi:preprotein translocase subunit Sec63
MSPWEVLGLEEGASVDAVRAAHREAVLLYHPDRFANAPASLRRAATQAMQEANAAHDVLLAAARNWAPSKEPSTAVDRYRPRNRWDRELAGEPAVGRHADLAA